MNIEKNLSLREIADTARQYLRHPPLGVVR
jgi:hypothetical protein